MANTKFETRVLLGKVHGEAIYLSAPSWDCGWYWGFGYLGNKYCHYHVDGLKEAGNLHDQLLSHFGDSFTLKRDADIWLFVELMRTFYTLREAAAVLGRGGSHYTANLCAETIKNQDEVKRINEVVLPTIFDAIHDVFTKAGA